MESNQKLSPIVTELFLREGNSIFHLFLGNISKYEFLTRKDVLPEKDMLEIAAALKRFEYSPLGSELKKQKAVSKTRQGF